MKRNFVINETKILINSKEIVKKKKMNITRELQNKK